MRFISHSCKAFEQCDMGKKSQIYLFSFMSSVSVYLYIFNDAMRNSDCMHHPLFLNLSYDLCCKQVQKRKQTSVLQVKHNVTTAHTVHDHSSNCKDQHVTQYLLI